MEDKIREYVNKKFEVCPYSMKLIEFREKLISIMIEKYRDCQYYGMSKQKSYSQALSAMNNYSEEEKRYSAKLSENLRTSLTSCHLYGGIA